MNADRVIQRLAASMAQSIAELAIQNAVLHERLEELQADSQKESD